MQHNPYENYLESQVLSASPLQLVSILYRAGIDALNSARLHLASGDIRSRMQSSTRAQTILAELAQSVNRQQGGAFADTLLELYAYILRRVHEANFHADDAAYREAIQLLSTLLEGWQALQDTLDPIASPLDESPTQHHNPIECSF